MGDDDDDLPLLAYAEKQAAKPSPDVRWQRLYTGVDMESLRQFNEYHARNPKVFELFEKFAREALRTGRKRFSHWMIMNRIRWYTQVETVGDEYKVNNNHFAFYVRKLIYEQPEFADLFELRGLGERKTR